MNTVPEKLLTTEDCLPFEELRSTGLLWLINRVCFHPRGFALALHSDAQGNIVGWALEGDGSEAWKFTDDQREDECFRAVEMFLAGRR